MATNLTIPPVSVPGTDPQQGARLLGAIRGGAIKFVPNHYYHLPFTYKDFIGAGAVLTIERVVSTQWPNRMFPANVYVKSRVLIDLQVEFAGGTVDSAVIDVGNAGDTDGIVDNLNVFTGAGTGMTLAINATGTDLYGFQAALALTFTLTTTTGNLNALTSGKGILYIVTEAIPRAR